MKRSTKKVVVTETTLRDVLCHYVELRFRVWESPHGNKLPFFVFESVPNAGTTKLAFATKEEAEDNMVNRRVALLATLLRAFGVVE